MLCRFAPVQLAARKRCVRSNGKPRLLVVSLLRIIRATQASFDKLPGISHKRGIAQRSRRGRTGRTTNLSLILVSLGFISGLLHSALAREAVRLRCPVEIAAQSRSSTRCEGVRGSENLGTVEGKTTQSYSRENEWKARREARSKNGAAEHSYPLSHLSSIESRKKEPTPSRGGRSDFPSKPDLTAFSSSSSRRRLSGLCFLRSESGASGAEAGRIDGRAPLCTAPRFGCDETPAPKLKPPAGYLRYELLKLY